MGEEKLRPRKLVYRDIVGSGKQIHADLPVSVNMIEFRTREGEQKIVETLPPGDGLNSFLCICFEPWIQFKAEVWNDMQDQVFKEMVDLWNEKYATE